MHSKRNVKCALWGSKTITRIPFNSHITVQIHIENPKYICNYHQCNSFSHKKRAHSFQQILPQDILYSIPFIYGNHDSDVNIWIRKKHKMMMLRFATHKHIRNKYTNWFSITHNDRTPFCIMSLSQSHVGMKKYYHKLIRENQNFISDRKDGGFFLGGGQRIIIIAT